MIFGQIITTSAEVTLNDGLVRELPQNPPKNSGLGIILICPDIYFPNAGFWTSPSSLAVGFPILRFLEGQPLKASIRRVRKLRSVKWGGPSRPKKSWSAITWGGWTTYPTIWEGYVFLRFKTPITFYKNSKNWGIFWGGFLYWKHMRFHGQRLQVLGFWTPALRSELENGPWMKM